MTPSPQPSQLESPSKVAKSSETDSNQDRPRFTAGLVSVRLPGSATFTLTQVATPPSAPARKPPRNLDGQIEEELRKQNIKMIFAPDGEITMRGAKMLADYLGLPTCTATKLCLSNTIMTKEVFSTVMEALKTNATVQEIDLSRCAYDYETLQLLVNALSINRSVKHIEIGWTDRQRASITAKIAAEIIALPDCPIRQIRLQQSHIGNEGAKLIADALKKNSTLESLDVGLNSITATGTQYLTEAIMTHPALKDFDINTNYFETQGALAIAELLSKNNNIQKLHMYGCAGKAAGVIAIAEALKVNTSLTELNMPAWFFGNEASIKLAEALIINKSVSRMDLRRAAMSDVAVPAWADMLRVNTTIENICFDNNSISSEGAKQLADALQANKTARLNLYANNINPRNQESLNSAVDDNRLTFS